MGHGLPCLTPGPAQTPCPRQTPRHVREPPDAPFLHIPADSKARALRRGNSAQDTAPLPTGSPARRRSRHTRVRAPRTDTAHSAPPGPPPAALGYLHPLRTPTISECPGPGQSERGRQGLRGGGGWTRSAAGWLAGGGAGRGAARTLRQVRGEPGLGPGGWAGFWGTDGRGIPVRLEDRGLEGPANPAGREGQERVPAGGGRPGSAPTVVVAVAPAVVAGHAVAVPAAVHLPARLSSARSDCGSGPARCRGAAS